MSHSSLKLLARAEAGWLGQFRLSEDLASWAQGAVVLLVLLTVALLAYEIRKQGRRQLVVVLTGIIATLLLAGAVLRPVELRKKGREVPGLVTVLLDGSHRLELPADDKSKTRAAIALGAQSDLGAAWSAARLQTRYFAEGLLDGEESPEGQQSSDLLQALRQAASGEGERPRALVVVSDGALARPGAGEGKEWEEAIRTAAGGVVVHTVSAVSKTPRDRSIRKVGFTGTAVAHQPMTLQIEVGCEPADTCGEVEVVVRELLEGQRPVELARGQTEGKEGVARLELEATLERAGGRVIEVELVGEDEDDVPENDRRILPVDVRRDRLRMLHVAGRPTYDVRALRMFLKSDESIDLISFFILRTPSDQVGARQEELALIPFPVDELFTDHLKSFDAVILQDIHAPRYRLNRHFRSIRDYVLSGGGLILVGGPTGFSSGGYAGSPVEEVLPVELPVHGELIARKPFTPLYTASGRAAPMLAGLRSTMGEELPQMSGANMLGRPREGALVLWQHPTIQEAGQSGGELMPVLALGEVGDGRTIAISVDSTHELRFGEAGAKTGGRAYADLWEGLLGWLMRDPRYESARTRLVGHCIAGKDQIIEVEPLPGMGDKIEVRLERLGTETGDSRVLDRAPGEGHRYVARGLAPGGYAARVQVGPAPPTRMVFACEVGGEPWADSRPDVGRLQAIAQATGGQFVSADDVRKLPEPQSTFVSVRRESRPLLPPWAWATAAAIFMSAHWVVRRAVGYA